jgi:hypothetical protein
MGTQSLGIEDADRQFDPGPPLGPPTASNDFFFIFAIADQPNPFSSSR